jgi:hypothetical protein
MGRKKKTIIGIKEIEEMNILHTNTVLTDTNTIQINNLDVPVIGIVDNNIILNDNIVEKKKRGRKKKILTQNNDDENINQNKKIFDIKKINDLDEKNNIEKKNDSDNKNSSDDNKNNFFKELLTKQLKNICASKKLLFSDIKRISKFLSDTIFDENKCSLWNGYITNEKNQSKGTYINFYFNKKKIALHRLLYINYIGDISNDEYIKFSCDNKGKCCCIYHMKKYSYNKQGEDIDSDNSNNVINENNNNIHINTNKEKLVVEF